MFAFLLAFAACILSLQAQHPLSTLKLPPGFNISIYAYKNLTEPRQMAVLQAGKATIVFAGSISQTKPFVYALIDYQSDGISDKLLVVQVVNNGYNPGSVAVNPKTNELWIGAVNLILRCPNANSVLNFGPADKLACKTFLQFPKSDSQYYFHAQRHMQINPKGEICIAKGAQGNELECVATQCKINCYTNNDASKPVVQAVGIRNSVGFDWHPTTGDMWFTDNGRDNLNGAAHQNMPDDEFNVVRKIGQHFGYPFCHSLGYGPPFVRSPKPSTPISDPDLNDSRTKDCTPYTMAQQPMGPHVAALGIRFVQPSNKMFPSSYQDTAIIAQHGSWDRDQKIGYRVSSVFLDSSNYPAVKKHEIFVTGWLNNQTQQVWGRPNDVQFLPDGSLLISDDGPASCIYRVVYNQAVEWDPEFTWAVVWQSKSEYTVMGRQMNKFEVIAAVLVCTAFVLCAVCMFGMMVRKMMGKRGKTRDEKIIAEVIPSDDFEMEMVDDAL